MQRASRGESFEITRRGKPFARLLPPVAQLALVDDAPISAEADAA
jgi:antitoxin (DNA-binding transcriptional repressor) of toxin-antitoxin stability system